MVSQSNAVNVSPYALDPNDAAVVSGGESLTALRATCSHQGHVSVVTALPTLSDGFALLSNTDASEVLGIGGTGKAGVSTRTSSSVDPPRVPTLLRPSE